MKQLQVAVRSTEQVFPHEPPDASRAAAASCGTQTTRPGERCMLLSQRICVLCAVPPHHVRKQLGLVVRRGVHTVDPVRWARAQCAQCAALSVQLPVGRGSHHDVAVQNKGRPVGMIFTNRDVSQRDAGGGTFGGASTGTEVAAMWTWICIPNACVGSVAGWPGGVATLLGRHEQLMEEDVCAEVNDLDDAVFMTSLSTLLSLSVPVTG